MSSIEHEAEYESYQRLPQAYAIEHNWGRFVVTQAAEVAYKLVPLCTVSAPEAEIPQDDTTVMLLGPNEHQLWDSANPDLKPGTFTEGAISTPFITAQGGVQLACSFKKDRRTMVQAEISALADSHKVSESYFLRKFTTENGIPVAEHVNQRLGTDLVHALYDPLFSVALIGLVEASRQRPLWKKLLPSSGIKELITASAIADDIHNDYCADYFNQQFSRSL